MAAEAVIAIRALDLTRQVFAGIQRSLAGLQSAVGKASAALGGFLTFTIAKRALMGFNNALRDVEKESEKFGATKDELDKVTRATGALDSMMQALKMGVVSAVNGVLDLKDALTGVSQVQSAGIAEQTRVERDLPKIKEMNKELDQMTREFLAIGETPAQHFARLADEIERANDEASDPAFSEELNTLMRQKEIVQLQIEQKKTAIKVNDDFIKGRERLGQTFEDEVQHLLTADQLYERLTGQVAALAAEEKALIQNLPKTFDPEGATEEEIAQRERLAEIYEKMVPLRQKLIGLETTNARIARQAGEIISQSFEDAILAGNKLSEVLRGLGQDLLRMAFREAVTAPLGTGLGNFFKNLFRAEGGPVGSGNPYIVGERGPELFVPRTSGSIVSNDRLAGASFGGGGINITYNIASGISRAELAPILDTERKRLKAEIPDMVRRGGAYRAAFA